MEGGVTRTAQGNESAMQATTMAGDGLRIFI
jgi:hypothetical protein